MKATQHPYYLCGKPDVGNNYRAITSMQDGNVLAEVAYADAGAIETTIAAMQWPPCPMVVKQSGLGRQGVRYAIEHFTELVRYA